MRLLLVPLDNRPCNYRFPVMLAEIGDIDLLVPPCELLGDFNKTANAEVIAKWVSGEFPRCSGAIISLDTLCFGGLVPSRESPKDPDETFNMVTSFLSGMKNSGDGFIWAFDSIMRTLPTTGKSLDNIIPNVSRFYSNREFFPSGKTRKYLENYLQLRNLKHRVDRKFMDLVAGGELDYIAYGLDDTGKKCPGHDEAKCLYEYGTGLKIVDKIYLSCGIDEMAMLLVARAGAKFHRYSPGIFFKFYPEEAGDSNPLYEDRALKEIAFAQVNLAGGANTNEKNADITILVHGTTNQVEASSQVPGRAPEEIIKALDSAFSMGKKVALADLKYANGADMSLIEGLADLAPVSRLYSYAGWNTAANSLGTVIAHSILRFLSTGGEKCEIFHQAFLLERLLDDGLYQGNLRREAREKFHDPEFAEPWIRQELSSRAENIFKKYFPGSPYKIQNLHVSLPWRRFFEVDIKVTLGPIGVL
ncbi:MAG: DUF4127 family protein [Candidatus Eremiobacteraeota bacterium]|nr:DUF4127 family protein [Candidatus Eremiobacteraeota bacterium]